VVRRFIHAIEGGDFAVFDDLVSSAYNDHLAGQSPGRENLKKYFAGVKRRPSSVREHHQVAPGWVH